MCWNVERTVDCVCLFLGDYSRKWNCWKSGVFPNLNRLVEPLHGILVCTAHTGGWVGRLYQVIYCDTSFRSTLTWWFELWIMMEVSCVCSQEFNGRANRTPSKRFFCWPNGFGLWGVGPRSPATITPMLIHHHIIITTTCHAVWWQWVVYWNSLFVSWNILWYSA
jgi:hypothetical protein